MSAKVRIDAFAGSLKGTSSVAHRIESHCRGFVDGRAFSVRVNSAGRRLGAAASAHRDIGLFEVDSSIESTRF